MSTARQIIYDAMYASGILGESDTAPSATTAQRGLRILQRMLDSWSADDLMIYAKTQETITLVASDATYTTANLSTASRPVDIEPAFIRASDNTDFPLYAASREQFGQISYKPSEGMPIWVWYEPKMTAGEFTFYPTPDQAYTAYFHVSRVLASSVTLDTSFSLPPGYEKAIVDNLAVEFGSGGWGVQPSSDMLRAAYNSKTTLKRQNWVPPVMSTPFDGTLGSNILEG